MELRHQKILAAIVKDYSETAQPVGSKEIGKKYRLDLSPATIRNEMALLEKQGFITQPHKSAGRVPTDKGYRFFVSELMRRFELSEKERKMLRFELIKLKREHEQLSASISSLLAKVSGQAAFALLPSESSATGFSQIISEPEFQDPKTLKETARLFEKIGDFQNQLTATKTAYDVQAFIGKGSPLPIPQNLSLVVSSVKMKDGKKAVLGILGPKRMAYAKNLSLLEYLGKLISTSAAIILILTR
jgi:transcriptional regulator of heat shock response